MAIRISRRVDFGAYQRTMLQLQRFNITEKDLPRGFYQMHWSERRKYLMNVHRLFMCPRCREVIAPDEKHYRKQLCQRCGEHTQQHTVYSEDEDAQLGVHPMAHVGISKSDVLAITNPRPSVITDILKLLGDRKTK